MPQLDVSAVLLFQNHEELIGTIVARIAAHLRTADISFELLAIDVDSQDNSTALLTLIRAQHPELRIGKAAPRRAHDQAAQQAHSQVLWFVSPDNIADALAWFDHTYPRLRERELDLATHRERGTLAHRGRTDLVFRGLRGRTRQMPHELTTRARRLGLVVEEHPRPRSQRATRSRWLAPLFSALSFDPSI